VLPVTTWTLGVPPQRLRALQVDVLGDVDLSALHQQTLRRAIALILEHDLVHGRACPPVVGVARQHDLHVARPVRQLKGAGADRLCVEKARRLIAFGGLRRVVTAVRLDHLGVEHAKVVVGERGQERDIGRAERDTHGVRVERPDVGRARDEEGRVIVEVFEPPVREDHVVGRHGVAAAETHAVA